MYRTLCGLVALIDISASFRLTTRDRRLALQDIDGEDLNGKKEFTTANRYSHDLNMLSKMEEKARHSLCIDSRLVPSVFLIGVQKGATSTLANELAFSPGVVFGKKGKELYFFKDEDWFKAKGGKDGYLQQFPLCPLNEKLVALDGSTDTFPSAFAPNSIREMYGDAAGKLTFILTIREPMHRMQSAFHQAKSMCANGTDASWRIKPCVCNRTFNQFVKETLISRQGSVLWEYSRYSPSLRRWFDVFDPSQFIIVPYLYVVDENRNPSELYQHMWRTLDVPSVRHVPHHLNNGSHPQLEDDLAPDVLEKLNRTFQALSNSRELARVLDRSGATLWGCSACDEEAIVDWIETGWR